MNTYLFLLAIVIAGTPASNHVGRTMSPSESQTAAVYPENTEYRWAGNDSIRCKTGGKWYIESIYGQGRTCAGKDKTDTIAEAIRKLSEGGMVYGQSVSRNEFGIDGGIFHSHNGRMTAFYRKDETAVTEFPLLDITTRTGSLKSIRYPMNGMASEKVSVGIYRHSDSSIIWLGINDFSEERYITNLSWSPDDSRIYAQIVDRAQHNVHLNVYNTADGSFAGTLLTEHNDAWVEPYEPVHFITNELFIYATDNRDGYKSLYLCNGSGIIKRLVAAEADVNYAGLSTSGNSRKGKASLFYTTAEFSPIENHLMKMEINWNGHNVRTGKPQRLTTEEGWHDILMSPDCSHFIDKWSSFNFPGAARIADAEGKTARELYTASNPLDGYMVPEIEYGTVKSADGIYDNYYRFFKPADFDPSKKYPLIVYVYGGPHSQMVKNKWLGSVRMWEMAMAQRGYAVYVQDNRGTSNRGSAFEKAINRQCGKAEMEDQIAGLDDLLERCPWIDRDRIGVHGWSYGGFMTISLAVNHPEYFKVAVAGGPVIDWKWYEVMYGERYMDTAESNPEGFSATSLIGRAKDLKAKLLICQGAIDNTVVWQHSLNFVQDCICNGVQLDYFPYPVSEHNMRGKARLHLYEKITDYFVTKL